MKRLLFPTLLVVSLLPPLAGFAQSTDVRRVCVQASDSDFARRVNHQVNSTPNVRTQRDLVVKYLNKPSANSRVKLEAVALTSTNSDAIRDEVSKVDCNFVVTLTINSPEFDKFAFANEPAPERIPGVIDSYIPQPAPIAFSILLRESLHLWVSLPPDRYHPYKWSAKDVAAEVHNAILKNPTP